MPYTKVQGGNGIAGAQRVIPSGFHDRSTAAARAPSTECLFCVKG